MLVLVRLRVWLFWFACLYVCAASLLGWCGPHWWSPRPLDSDPRQWRQSYKPCVGIKAHSKLIWDRACINDRLVSALLSYYFFLCYTWVWIGSAPPHVQSARAHCSRLTRCCSPQTSGCQTSEKLNEVVLRLVFQTPTSFQHHQTRFIISASFKTGNMPLFQCLKFLRMPIKINSQTQSYKLWPVVERTLLKPAWRRGRTDGSSWSAGLQKDRKESSASAATAILQKHLYTNLHWFAPLFKQSSLKTYSPVQCDRFLYLLFWPVLLLTNHYSEKSESVDRWWVV